MYNTWKCGYLKHIKAYYRKQNSNHPHLHCNNSNVATVTQLVSRWEPKLITVKVYAFK